VKRNEGDARHVVIDPPAPRANQVFRRKATTPNAGRSISQADDSREKTWIVFQTDLLIIIGIISMLPVCPRCAEKKLKSPKHINRGQILKPTVFLFLGTVFHRSKRKIL
jgi:hypothetical protein